MSQGRPPGADGDAEVARFVGADGTADEIGQGDAAKTKYELAGATCAYADKIAVPTQTMCNREREGGDTISMVVLIAAAAVGILKNGDKLRSAKQMMGVERASAKLLALVETKRSLIIAEPGSEALRMLDYFNAESSTGGDMNSCIILRKNPSKAAVLEEFLHGTQFRLGIIDRLGTHGLGSAETHVKDFMIRHRNMLGLCDKDVRLLRVLRDKGL